MVFQVALSIFGHVGEEATEEDEEDPYDNSENDEFGHSRMVGLVFVPRTTALTEVFLELLGAELVVNETAECDSIAENLEE